MPFMTPAEKISRETWNRMRDAESLGVSQGEETLTDHLILELKAHERTYGIKLIQTKKREEAKSGTDLEIVVRHGGNHARKYAIQAKKLHRGVYKYIGRSTPSGSRQICVLEDYAKKAKAIPCYLLYNYTESSPCSAAYRFWHCCRCCEEPQFGCTLVPSWVIRKAIRNRPAAKSFDFMHQHQSALPWRCLFDCPRTKYDMPDDFLNSFKTESSYEWISFEPVENAWPERLIEEAGDSDADFIRRYCEWQGLDYEYCPRRLLLIDPMNPEKSFTLFYHISER